MLQQFADHEIRIYLVTYGNEELILNKLDKGWIKDLERND